MPQIHPPSPSRPHDNVGRRRRLALLIALVLATLLLVAPAIARQVLAGDAGQPPATAPGGSPATLPPG